jgi:CheY-like chemotaxis protein
MPPAASLQVPARNVLVLVEDDALTDLLLDALARAGHRGQLAANGPREAEAALKRSAFHAAIIDVDARARNGAELVRIVRRVSPSTVVIALLPSGGLPRGQPPPPYHLGVEKPARLGTLLSALALSHSFKRG